MFLLVALGMLGLVAAAPGAAPPVRGRTEAESLQTIDRLVTEAIDPAGPGAAVLVMRGGKVLLQKGYGLADLDSKTPVTTTTTFELASLSKPFTALAVLILAERGKLDLADDVRKHVPELPVFDEKRPIRITDLLQHTSGLPDYVTSRELEGYSKRTSADLIKAAAKGKLAFPTGSKWGYSNTNYRLLSVIVERVSGQDFAAFLKAEVFDPLGMKHTFVRDQRKPAVQGRATGYMPGLGLIPAWKYSRTNTEFVLVGEAGVWSCVEDLARWERELRKPTLISRSSLERAWTPGKLDNGKPILYGLGWEVIDTSFGRMVRHTGGWPGFTTCFVRFPQSDLSVAVLRNYFSWSDPSASSPPLAARSSNLLLVAAPAEKLTLTAAQNKVLPGVYKREGEHGPAKVEVVQRKGRMYLVLPNQLPFPLLPVSPTQFYIDGWTGEQVAFEMDHGDVRRLRLVTRTGQPILTFRPPERAELVTIQ
jgi:CubicO group peptidase (beta-lactamase class C family)